MRGLYRSALMVFVVVGAVAPVRPAGAEQEKEVPFVLAGRELFYLRATVAGYTPRQRWGQLQQRIVQILAQPDCTKQPVIVAKKGLDATISVGKRLFITVTQADARVNKTRVTKLAKLWADKLRAALPLADPAPPPGMTRKRG
jgi:hypothetical protein